MDWDVPLGWLVTKPRNTEVGMGCPEGAGVLLVPRKLKQGVDGPRVCGTTAVCGTNGVWTGSVVDQDSEFGQKFC